MMPEKHAERWRIGRSYGIHVYTDTGDRKNDAAVATFHDPEDAFVAVRDHNRALDSDDA